MDNENYHDSFHSLSVVSRKVAARLGWENEQKRWDMIRLWQNTFGDPVARVSYPLSVHGEEIVIACESALWKRELTYLLPEIRSRLAHTGSGLENMMISFRIVKPFHHPVKRKSPDDLLSPDQIERLWNRAGEISSSLPEPLRSRAQSFVFRQMINGIHLEHKSV
ncbi:MAG: DUF721 domain-containing protein [Nitrospirota bacterium]|nr:DUF721 domain-containing protein [Nitrospirota bacterium]